VNRSFQELRKGDILEVRYLPNGSLKDRLHRSPHIIIRSLSPTSREIELTSPEDFKSFYGSLPKDFLFNIVTDCETIQKVLDRWNQQIEDVKHRLEQAISFWTRFSFDGIFIF